MALDIEQFREVGGPGNQANGGQFYSVSSSTDSLATMLAADYLLDLAATLNVRDSVLLNGTDGSAVAQVASNDGSTLTVTTNSNTGVASILAGAGAVPITARSADVESTGTDTMTVADGAVGQLLNITHVIDGGSAVITPANGLGYTTVTMADLGDSVQLEFKSGGWAVIGLGGLATGPVVA